MGANIIREQTCSLFALLSVIINFNFSNAQLNLRNSLICL